MRADRHQTPRPPRRRSRLLPALIATALAASLGTTAAFADGNPCLTGGWCSDHPVNRSADFQRMLDSLAG